MTDLTHADLLAALRLTPRLYGPWSDDSPTAWRDIALRFRSRDIRAGQLATDAALTIDLSGRFGPAGHILYVSAEGQCDAIGTWTVIAELREFKGEPGAFQRADLAPLWDLLGPPCGGG